MIVNKPEPTNGHAAPPIAPMVAIKVRIPALHADQLAANAREHDRTPAAELRRAVRLYLQSLHAG